MWPSFPNTFCSDDGKYNLDSPFECMQAAHEIGFTFVQLLSDDSKFPAACFRKISVDTAFWNPADVGSRNTDAEPICRDYRNYTLACCIFRNIEMPVLHFICIIQTPWKNSKNY